MENNNDSLKLYVSKVLDFTNLVKKLFKNNFFQDNQVHSICILRYRTTDSPPKNRLMLDFYDCDGLFMLDKDKFSSIEDVKKMVSIIESINQLPPIYIAEEPEMQTISIIKDCEKELLEVLLPKSLQIEIDYNDLKDNLGENIDNKQVKTKI
jgi:hypothetical protein